MCRISGSIKRVKCLGIQLYVLRKHHVLLATCSSQIIICAVAWFEH